MQISFHSIWVSSFCSLVCFIIGVHLPSYLVIHCKVVKSFQEKKNMKKKQQGVVTADLFLHPALSGSAVSFFCKIIFYFFCVWVITFVILNVSLHNSSHLNPPIQFPPFEMFRCSLFVFRLPSLNVLSTISFSRGYIRFVIYTLFYH